MSIIKVKAEDNLALAWVAKGSEGPPFILADQSMPGRGSSSPKPDLHQHASLHMGHRNTETTQQDQAYLVKHLVARTGKPTRALVLAG